MDIEVLKLRAWIVRSSYREKVVKALYENEILMPMEISKKTGINKHHISNVLSKLKEKKIIMCINEEESKGRIYCMTDFGKDIVGPIMDR